VPTLQELGYRELPGKIFGDAFENGELLALDKECDWRPAAEWLEEILIDHDVYSNYVSWAMAAGVTEGAREQVQRCEAGEWGAAKRASQKNSGRNVLLARASRSLVYSTK